MAKLRVASEASSNMTTSSGPPLFNQNFVEYHTIDANLKCLPQLSLPQLSLPQSSLPVNTTLTMRQPNPVSWQMESIIRGQATTELFDNRGKYQVVQHRGSSGSSTQESPHLTRHRMGHRVNDVMQLCCELSPHHQIRATVKRLFKGAATAGGLALAGGLVGGPLGIAVGGAVGSLLSCWLTSGQFKPLPQVLMELSPQQKQKLYDDMMAILGDIQWTDLMQLTDLVTSNVPLKQRLIGAILGYVTKELQAVVRYVD